MEAKGLIVVCYTAGTFALKDQAGIDRCPSDEPLLSGGSMIYRFADCALDTQLYTLHRAGQSTRLPPKVFEVLCYLIEHRDRVVSKQELCEQVWEGVLISDATLESCLRSVRLTVGDSGQAQRIIQTQRDADR